MLAAVGYSYVSLRLIDVARAVLEGRHRPPDLLSTINYLFPFHMLAAGPIQAYDEFVGQPQFPLPCRRPIRLSRWSGSRLEFSKSM